MLSDIVKRFHPLPAKSKIVILGGGFSGQHIASVLRSLGNEVLCSRRNKTSKGADFIFDSNQTSSTQWEEIFDGTTHLLSCIPPLDNGKDPVLSQLKAYLSGLNLKWAGYLSTTGVYGDSKGNWVNENDLPNPKQKRSIRRLTCEKEWTQSGLPIQILRLPGIYGPGRSAIDNLIKGKPKMIDKPDQVFSRIHIDDIAGAILFLMDLAKDGTRPEIINIADNLPTSNIEVLTFASQILGTSLPKVEQFETASKAMNAMALSFWQENRRVSNNLLCKELGYSLIHPNYKSGLQDCFRQLQISKENLYYN